MQNAEYREALLDFALFRIPNSTLTTSNLTISELTLPHGHQYFP